jgi:hypothetical protein
MVRNPFLARSLATALVAIGIVAAQPLHAAIAVVRSDEAMVRTAPAIVTGTVIDVYARHDDRGDIETVTRILVDEAIKGSVPAGEIVDVVQFGGRLDGSFQAQSGAPRYELGGRYLVFLDRNGRGHWTTFDLELGQFRFVNQLLVRDTHDIAGWTESGEPFRDSDRGAPQFLARVRELVKTTPHIAATALKPAPALLDYDLKATTQSAVSAWAGAESAMSDSVSASPAGGDTMNLGDCESRVIPDDPHGDVAGTFNGSGIVATAFFGGTCLCGACADTVQNGETYGTINVADVVVNDGVSSSTLPNSGNFLTALVHEIGHTWGFRHSNQDRTNNGGCSAPLECSGNAIMNSSIVGGLNGSLQAWDQHAANEVYGNGSQTTFPGSGYTFDAGGGAPVRRPAAMSWRIVPVTCPAPPAPTISANPSTPITAGQQVQLSATSAGATGFSWFTGAPGNTSNSVGSGSSIFVSPSTTTSYWVRASACSPPLTTNSASSVTITVQACVAPSQATASAVPNTISSGGGTTLSVANNGTGPFTYQWFTGNPPSGTPINNATSQSVILSNITTTTTFYVEITNSCGRFDSTPVTVTVTACTPPTQANLNANPTTITAGNFSTLSLGVNGTGPFTFQWFTGNPPSGSIINGATQQTLQAFPTATTTYFARVSNACGGPIDSNAVTVTVAAQCTPPSAAVATATPGSIQSGQTANLAVTASGTGLSFQWFTGTPPGGTAIVGATNATVPVTPTATTTYYAHVTGQCGTPIDSNPVTVTVSAACVDPSITAQPAGKTIIVGTGAALSVTAAGTAPLHYQWFEGATGDTSTPRGTDSPTLNTGPLTKKTQFWVQVRGNCPGDHRANSNTATIDVQPGRHHAAKH